MNLCQVNLKTPGGEDNTMQVDMYKEQALVTWVNVIVQSKDTEIRIHGLEDVLEKRCLSILNSLLQIPFLQQESEEMNPLKELFQYVDGFYKNAISSQKLVDFELLQTTRRTKELRVEWCKFLLLLLAAAVQDRGREAFVTPATILASFLQVNIKDMLEVIINADQVPADFAAILFKSSSLESLSLEELEQRKRMTFLWMEKLLETSKEEEKSSGGPTPAKNLVAVEWPKESSETEPADLDKLKQHADRFGTVVSQSLTKVVEAERIQKRKKRFGEVAAAAASTKKVRTASPKPSNLSPAEEEL